jgi:hypothetical protein
MDEQRLAEIEARAAAATEGPWSDGIQMASVAKDGVCANCGKGSLIRSGGKKRVTHFHFLPRDTGGQDLYSSATGAMVVGTYDYDCGGIVRKEDCEFIGKARKDVPDLIAEVRRLQAALAAKG